jgi:soluble lytic murein transglycosylase
MTRLMRWIILILSLVAISGIGLAWLFRFELGYHRYRVPIHVAATRYRVPPHLIAALVWQETRFHPTRRGQAGEIGLMQIMPDSAREWAKAERIPNFQPTMLLDPQTNLLAGTWYLARATQRWSQRRNPLPYALAEYNAGRSNTLRWDQAAPAGPDAFMQAISYPGTRNYVRSILKRFHAVGRPWELWFDP